VPVSYGVGRARVPLHHRTLAPLWRLDPESRRRAGVTTLYAITVDTEEEWDWSRGWPTHGVTVGNISRLGEFQQLCSRHGAAVTYFANHAVLADDDGRRTIELVNQATRVEVGCHIHPWNTPPIENHGVVAARETFLHNLPTELALAKLQTVYDQFTAAGFAPVSFRGGRYSTSDVIQDFLRCRGFVADASICPFTTWSDDGAPDYRRRDLLPVRRSGTNGAPALWEIPLTLAFTRRPFALWGRFYHFVQRRPWLSALRLIGVAERLGLVRRIWLNFEYQDAASMLRLLRKLRSMQARHVCLTVHSSSLTAGMNSYTPDADAEKRIWNSLDLVLSELASWPDFEPATIRQIAETLEKEYHESPRD